MNGYRMFDEGTLRYLSLLAQQYPTQQAAFTEIINLQAIRSLPKGTEHFMSDLHGEYEAFRHILNNCSGVIREKVRVLFGSEMTKGEQAELCTLIYYPREKLERMRSEGRYSAAWCRETLDDLVRLARFVSSKYTRSKVRKAMPQEFGYIIDELLHAQKDEDGNQQVYHAKILDTILETDSGDDFICALAALIKRLAVDHLHIVGDIYDRGPRADRIMDILMGYHSLDIEWGNHDILWLGAFAGCDACITAVLYNNIRYGNLEILENGYGISLRELSTFADAAYRLDDGMTPLVKAITVLLFKTEGALLRRHPEYGMDDRRIFETVDWAAGTVVLDGKKYALASRDFPTVDPADPCALSPDEERVLKNIRSAFRNSDRLRRHMEFLCARGAMYRCWNGNLLFHGCVPLDGDGNLDEVELEGAVYHGRAYLDAVDRLTRRACAEHAPEDVDAMWYLWTGRRSPLCGRNVKTFERAYLAKESAWKEAQNPYYTFCQEEKTCVMLLHEFGLYTSNGHIINGHTPVKAVSGESPIKAGGKLLVIDGGFCKAYQKKTGIAGYTLIYTSHCMKIKAHRPFESIEKALTENADIKSETDVFEQEASRVMVGDTDIGQGLAARIADLQQLLEAYRSGQLKERK